MTSKNGNLRDMVRTCSFNHSSFTNTIVPSTIHIPCSSYIQPCDVYTWAATADDYAKYTLRLPIQNYKHFIYVLPKGDFCGFGGLGTVGPCGNGACRVWISGMIPHELPAYLHELGHNLGLGHAEYMGDQYGDLTDTMGYCCNMRCFSAPNTHTLGWSKSVKKITLPIYDTKEFKLKASEYVIILDPVRMERIFVQYRTSNLNKYERSLPRSAINIYMLPYARTQGGSTKRYASLIQKASNWYGNRFHVTVKDMTSTNAVISIAPASFDATIELDSRIPL